MEVILLQRVKKLGFTGDIVTVKPGYARNFLIPNNVALRATEESKKYFETQKTQIELDSQNMKKEAEHLLAKLDNKDITIIRTASEVGHLYAAVRPQDICDALAVEGFVATKTQIHINTPIKSLGVAVVEVQLHPEIYASLLVNVARSVDEASTALVAYKKALSKTAEEKHLDKKDLIKEAELDFIEATSKNDE